MVTRSPRPWTPGSPHRGFLRTERTSRRRPQQAAPGANKVPAPKPIALKFVASDSNDSEPGINTFASAEELENPGYHEKNPRQKNFVGVLHGVRNGKILLTVSPLDGQGSKKKGQAKKAKSAAGNQSEENARKVMIPLSLVSNAQPRSTGQ